MWHFVNKKCRKMPIIFEKIPQRNVIYQSRSENILEIGYLLLKK